jgi:hypothetical protein
LNQALPGLAPLLIVSLAKRPESANGLTNRRRGSSLGSRNRRRASLELGAQPSPAIRDPGSLAAASAEPESSECAKRLVHDDPSDLECDPIPF